MMSLASEGRGDEREKWTEDVERRAWFERYGRGGLAYQHVAEEEEGENDGATTPGVEGCGEGGMNGREVAEGLERKLTTVEDPAATV
jgi:hypothetical protein